MTTSTAAATVRHALLAAAMRGDRPRREAAGMAMPAPQAGQPETGRRRWAALALVSRGLPHPPRSLQVRSKSCRSDIPTMAVMAERSRPELRRTS